MLVFHIDLNFTSLREDYLRAWLKRLSAMGFTAILWELEDKIAWETCPECVAPEAMEKRVFREVLDYARSLGLENIPLLQTVGHAEYVLKHPQYHAWREDPAWHDCYCTSHPEVRAFLKRWVLEYLELFGSDLRQFHLGGDEAYRFASCPGCRERAGQIGLNQLYAEHLQDLAAALLQRKIIPGVWGDMLLAHPDQIDALPRHFRIWDWNYWDGTEAPARTLVWGRGTRSRDEIANDDDLRRRFPELLSDHGELRPFHSALFLKNRGWDVVLCGSSRASGDSFFVGCHDIRARNVVGVSQTARRERLSGACVTSWGVRVHPWEVQWPCLHLAARAWNNPAMDFKQMETQVLDAYLGGLPPEVLEALGRPFPFFRFRENGIQFNHLKDPVPAPAGFIRDLVEEWRREGEVWSRIQREIEEGRELMAATSARLEAHDFGDGSDPAISAAFRQAARFQSRAVEIAAAVVRVANKAAPPGHGAAEAAEARRAMEAWTGERMTPRYARLIAGLVFGNLEAYLAEPFQV